MIRAIYLLFISLLLCMDASASHKDTISIRREVKGEVVKYTYKINDRGHVYNREVWIKKRLIVPEKINKGNISLLVSKTHYTVYLMYNKKPIKSYKAVFGSGGHLEDKKQKGDKKTPEGIFKINSIRKHGEWFMFLGLDYPTLESYQKFKENKQKKRISQNAQIGGAIGIHGTFGNQDEVVNRKFNWTDGCISMKNSDLAEIVKYLQVGTVVRIIK